MIDFLKENYIWLGATVIPILAAVIGAVAVIIKKSGRKQKVGSITGDGNIVINGDIKK